MPSLSAHARVSTEFKSIPLLRHLCRHIGGCFPGQQFRVDGLGALPVLELNRPHPMAHPLVHFIQHHVGQQWRQRTALRRPFVATHCYAVHQDAAGPIGSHQPDDSGIGDPPPQTVDQDVVIDPVEELFAVAVRGSKASRCAVVRRFRRCRDRLRPLRPCWLAPASRLAACFLWPKPREAVLTPCPPVRDAGRGLRR